MTLFSLILRGRLSTVPTVGTQLYGGTRRAAPNCVEFWRENSLRYGLQPYRAYSLQYVQM
jgi:hypothetical protein